MYDGRMLFIVDGYNVTRSDPATRSLDLDAQREALVRRLDARGSGLLGAGRITVVFDGAEGAGESVGRGGAVSVVFARSSSADDAIVELARRSSGDVAVVTGDRELLDRVRAHLPGAQGIAPSACFEGARPNKRPGRRPGATRRDVGLPKGANRITEELKDLWLKGHDE